MGEKRRRFSREFKLEAVRQALEGGCTQVQAAQELGIKKETLYRWVREFRNDPEQSFPGNGQLKDRDKEIEDLRRQVARLKGENAFLKKVSSYFVKGQR